MAVICMAGIAVASVVVGIGSLFYYRLYPTYRIRKVNSGDFEYYVVEERWSIVNWDYVTMIAYATQEEAKQVILSEIKKRKAIKNQTVEIIKG